MNDDDDDEDSTQECSYKAAVGVFCLSSDSNSLISTSPGAEVGTEGNSIPVEAALTGSSILGLTSPTVVEAVLFFGNLDWIKEPRGPSFCKYGADFSFATSWNCKAFSFKTLEESLTRASIWSLLDS